MTMDAYNFYLSTFRYVMNAKSDDKATWCDIFKYLPCLRQMLSCSVCGSLLLRPYGPKFSVCLHHVCHDCLGGRMRLRPSCSWCKNPENFSENKKLRVLVICFKRLCAYVSHSNLGAEISKASINGYGSEAEKTMKVLEEADQFQDDYALTPPPTELPLVSKSTSGGFKSSAARHFSKLTSALCTNIDGSSSTQTSKRKRGRPRRMSKIPIKVAKNKSNISQHVKRLKKRAINSKVKNTVKKAFLKPQTQQKHERKRKSFTDTSGLLISQRPHRDRSGKSSIGQLWRETFLEEVQPESYPDSGIEVGNSSDQDQYLQPPHLTKLVTTEKAEPVTNSDIFCKETRHHKYFDHPPKETSVNDVTSTTGELQKPRLTLTISKKRYQHFSRRGLSQNLTSHSNAKESLVTFGNTLMLSVAPAETDLKKSRSKTRSAKQRPDICKCARFKQPNQLTCFGQKCPCYSERRACVDCLCNGCKNPLRSSDLAPPLMHIIKDSDGLDASFDRSMPRLSPIPRP